MSLSEFDLIREYFSNNSANRKDVILGVGDDCALLQPPPGMQMAVTSDTLVEGVHFFPGADPVSLGHKALAVNLSDLAAMGAEPAWVTLALTMPGSDPGWVKGFSKGFLSLESNFNVALVGGDTTSGPLSITVTAHGFVEQGKALTRSGAHVGDLVYVTGTLGDAGLGLKIKQGSVQEVLNPESVQQALDCPNPRISAGLVLRELASSAIDISDGLVSDLGHICSRSGVGADVFLDRIPLSPTVSNYLESTNDWSTVVGAGDDYELCFTLPAGKQEQLNDMAKNLVCGLTHIGEITDGDRISFYNSDGSNAVELKPGYQHFA